MKFAATAILTSSAEAETERPSKQAAATIVVMLLLFKFMLNSCLLTNKRNRCRDVNVAARRADCL
jgi:hypothetical protein